MSHSSTLLESIVRTSLLLATALCLGAALLLLLTSAAPQPACAQGLVGAPPDGALYWVQAPEANLKTSGKTLHMEGASARNHKGTHPHCCLSIMSLVFFPYWGIVGPLTIGLFHWSINRVKKARAEALSMVLNYELFREARLHVRTAFFEALSTLLLWAVLIVSPLILF